MDKLFSTSLIHIIGDKFGIYFYLRFSINGIIHGIILIFKIFINMNGMFSIAYRYVFYIRIEMDMISLEMVR